MCEGPTTHFLVLDEGGDPLDRLEPGMHFELRIVYAIMSDGQLTRVPDGLGPDGAEVLVGRLVPAKKAQH